MCPLLPNQRIFHRPCLSNRCGLRTCRPCCSRAEMRATSDCTENPPNPRDVGRARGVQNRVGIFVRFIPEPERIKTIVAHVKEIFLIGASFSLLTTFPDLPSAPIALAERLQTVQHEDRPDCHRWNRHTHGMHDGIRNNANKLAVSARHSVGERSNMDCLAAADRRVAARYDRMKTRAARPNKVLWKTTLPQFLPRSSYSSSMDRERSCSASLTRSWETSGGIGFMAFDLFIFGGISYSEETRVQSNYR